MSRYFCHEFPELLTLETRVVHARPGAVVLEQTPFHPGGSGQLADRGLLRWNGGETPVIGFELADGRLWHRLATPVEPSGVVEIVGLDRQACGGAHLASTARSRSVKILKIDNKGRHNRRVKIGLAGV